MADHRRSALARRPFPAHWAFRPLLAALLEGQQREWRAKGNAAAADVLARIVASPNLTRLVRELERRRTRRLKAQGIFKWPTTAAFFWRNLGFRRLLQKNSQHAAALAAFRWAARDEAGARAVCAASILVWLAEAATQPDQRTQGRIDEHLRRFEEERGACQVLRDNGLADQARGHATKAVMCLWIADNLRRNAAPDADELLRAISIKLMGLFGFRGYRVSARLVSAALNCRISERHTRYVVSFFTQ